MIKREIAAELHECCAEYPVVTILGPRQSGKTVLVKENFPKKKYLSLEDPDIRLAAELDPRGFLQQVDEGAILDEVQRLPILLSYLQGIVDRVQKPGMFILTGSHQPELRLCDGKRSHRHGRAGGKDSGQPGHQGVLPGTG